MGRGRKSGGVGHRWAAESWGIDLSEPSLRGVRGGRSGRGGGFKIVPDDTCCSESGWPQREVARYRFEDTEGKWLFSKVKFELDASVHRVSKTFRYMHPVRNSAGVRLRTKWAKPPGADEILYGLRALVLSGGEEWVYWTEGEKDADTVVGLGEVAVSHHQAAGNSTLGQAKWLSGRRIVVVLDRDKAGSFCGVRRLSQLREVGVKDKNIEVAWPAVGKDVSEHVEEGLHLSELVGVDWGVVEAEAAEERAARVRGVDKYVGRG
jgi:hypothetical protein